MTTIRPSKAIAVLALCVVMIGVSVSLSGSAMLNHSQSKAQPSNASAKQLNEKQHESDTQQDQISEVIFGVSVHQPAGPPRVATGQKDANGQAVTVSCSTCHATRPPNLQNKKTEDLDEFHREMPFSHGNVSCLSCHNENDYDSLKLADGSRVEFTKVMSLCAQCHGPQMTAYEHGAHGGMTGFWDRSKGPQVKNNCIDCHNPHAPQFPRMHPTFKPHDRFLSPEH